MDQELSTLKLNINQLAGITGVHRQTVTARLKQLEPALGSNNKLKLYLITDVLTELMAPVVASNAEDMTPSDRLAHWKAENERLKFEQDTGQLIPADEVAREFSVMAKAVVQVLETLPDILERDCALNPAAVSRVQSVIDDLRDQIAQRVLDAEPEEDEPEED
ncbi:DUF1441 family protein [Citrobacter braakii]|uniref:DUF1441 family protein n=1 Tax=Citrobacter sp. Cb004 TaxID=2985006 RepID=UPI002575F487|nr:DUF1441 family protein [Citrobacter sp. Cb004]ELN4158464.1 DUF1441 family protein [Citrobacter braakii]MDM3357590.1 DUF1441 family protein [Citrobacter sp. Cb004]